MRNLIPWTSGICPECDQHPGEFHKPTCKHFTKGEPAVNLKAEAEAPSAVESPAVAFEMDLHATIAKHLPNGLMAIEAIGVLHLAIAEITKGVLNR
tara:strand:- start:26277 stop:26564 length:288 start_codon:yes stop_codon:yes gene_type:complete